MVLGDTSRARCNGLTRARTHCQNYAASGERYCKKHAPLRRRCFANTPFGRCMHACDPSISVMFCMQHARMILNSSKAPTITYNHANHSTKMAHFNSKMRKLSSDELRKRVGTCDTRVLSSLQSALPFKKRVFFRDTTTHVDVL